MQDNVFIDTNIFIYLTLKDESHNDKRLKAIKLMDSLLSKNIVISTQVLNEYYNVLLKKNINDDIIQEKLLIIIDKTIIQSIDIDTIKLCWDIRKKYKYSYFDSLIIAAALQNNCSILYTEDLHHEQLIENKMRIINPLK